MFPFASLDRTTRAMSQTRRDAPAEENKEDEDDVPLHRKRPFGSGIRMEPVKFVPASSDLQSVATEPSSVSTQAGQSAADAYLSIVMAKAKTKPPSEIKDGDASDGPPQIFCETCRVSVGTTEQDHRQHQTTMAHQLSLQHSHPPSALDRSRMGLTYLRTYGWDPDSRKGLGADAQGIVYPLKGTVREDNAGLGIDTKPEDGKKEKKPEPKPRRLDAGKVRKKAEEDRKKTERLRQQLYSNVDLEKYLGSGA